MQFINQNNNSRQSSNKQSSSLIHADQGSSNSSERVGYFNAKWIDLLFVRLRCIYLNNFLSGIPLNDVEIINSIKQEWLGALINIPLFVIKPVLDYCRNKLIFPPSISEFRQLCLEFLAEAEKKEREERKIQHKLLEEQREKRLPTREETLHCPEYLEFVATCQRLGFDWAIKRFEPQ